MNVAPVKWARRQNHSRITHPAVPEASQVVKAEGRPLQIMRELRARDAAEAIEEYDG